MTDEQALRLSERIVEAARDLLADPNNMEKRRAYMQRVFNIDRAAMAWVAMHQQAARQTTNEAGQSE